MSSATSQPLAVNPPDQGQRASSPRLTGAKQKQIIEQNGWATWMFSYSCPFTITGNRLYIRSYDYLWCIGQR